MIRLSKLTIAVVKNLNNVMNATYRYSNFKVCLRLIFQGEFRNSTFLENPSNESNQLVQRWNKYYTCIRALCFWFTMYVSVCYFVNATLQRVFWLSWKNKSENDLQRFVIVYFIFTYKSIFFIKVYNKQNFFLHGKKDLLFKYIFSLFFDCGLSLIVLIVIAHGQKLSA